MVYAGDSQSRMAQTSIFDDPENKVSKYRQSKCENPEDSAQDNEESTARGISLRQLAREYVTSLQVPAAHRKNMKVVLEYAMKPKSGAKSKDLFDALGENMTPAQMNLLKEARHAAAMENREHLSQMEIQIAELQMQVSSMQVSARKSGEREPSPMEIDGSGGTPSGNVDNSSTQAAATTAPKRKRKDGTNDL